MTFGLVPLVITKFIIRNNELKSRKSIYYTE